jgi:hypothetical protein
MKQKTQPHDRNHESGDVLIHSEGKRRSRRLALVSGRLRRMQFLAVLVLQFLCVSCWSPHIPSMVDIVESTAPPHCIQAFLACRATGLDSQIYKPLGGREGRPTCDELLHFVGCVGVPADSELAHRGSMIGNSPERAVRAANSRLAEEMSAAYYNNVYRDRRRAAEFVDKVFQRVYAGYARSEVDEGGLYFDRSGDFNSESPSKQSVLASIVDAIPATPEEGRCVERLRAQLTAVASEPIRPTEDDSQFAFRMRWWRPLLDHFDSLFEGNGDREMPWSNRGVWWLGSFGQLPSPEHDYRDNFYPQRELTLEELASLRARYGVPWTGPFAFLPEAQMMDYARATEATWTRSCVRGMCWMPGAEGCRLAYLRSLKRREDARVAAAAQDAERRRQEAIDAQDREQQRARAEVLSRRFARVLSECSRVGMVAAGLCTEMAGLSDSERESCRARCGQAVEAARVSAERAAAAAARAAEAAAREETAREEEAQAEAAARSRAAAARDAARTECMNTCRRRSDDAAACERVCASR